MRLIDNINVLLGVAFKGSPKFCSKLKVAASCFSICAYVALKEKLTSASVYQENPLERIYLPMLYRIFEELLDNFPGDAATGLFDNLETYNGCILADNGLNYSRSLKTDLFVGEDGILRRWQRPNRLLRTRNRRRRRQATFAGYRVENPVIGPCPAPTHLTWRVER